MKANSESVEEYLKRVPAIHRVALERVRSILHQELPEGFEETIGYGMLAWVVPLSLYPQGYHCRPEEPLPFINLAAQKQHLTLYHGGLYADQALNAWFTEAYEKACGRKPNMGKSCVRFRKSDGIPEDLLRELFRKISVEQWISTYEAGRQRNDS